MPATAVGRASALRGPTSTVQDGPLQQIGRFVDDLPLWPNALKPHLPKIIAPKNPQDRQTLPPGVKKKVLIVGGGIAALSSALELAERGYDVKVVEKNPDLGGRLETRHLTTAVGEKNVIHGHHEFFNGYHTLWDIVDRLGVRGNFRPHNAVDFAFRTYKPERLESSPAIYPINLLAIVLRSPNLRTKIFSLLKDTPAFLDIMFFDTEKARKKWDSKTFRQWADERHVSKEFWDVIMEPAASVTLNDVEKISAAQMLELMHLYFISQPQAMNRMVATSDHETALIKPWRQYLEDNGVQFETGHEVKGLRFEDGKAVGEVGDRQNYDWVVLSANIPGTQQILTNSVASDQKSAAALDQIRTTADKLKVAPEYHVLRVWLDKKPDAGRPDILETPQHHPINLVAQFNKIEDEAKAWSDRTGGSVFEFHLYNTPKLNGMAPEDIWTAIRPVAVEVMPELAAAKLEAATVTEKNDFTSYEVGQQTIRPGADFPQKAGISNLALAGDWVQTRYPSALMERAVCTGREAANIALLGDRVRQVKIPVCPSRGPGLGI